MQDLASGPTFVLDTLAPGAVIAGRYEVRLLLGEGGMGTVYRAFDREIDEDIALKTLRVDMATNPLALARFRREVQLARRVTHPNVARTYDLGSHGTLRFLTMELITGATLAAVSRKGVSLPEALRVTAAVARGLAAAHAAGVVHRDLKPENVILAGERVAITDFGIARLAEGASEGRDMLQTAGTIVGTPAYMAPEQVEGRAVDGRADVFALGVVLFELLARRLPFSGDSPLAQAAARLVGSAPDLREAAPDALVPQSVADLVKAMLATARDARPDAETVLERIERLRGGAAHGRESLQIASPSLSLNLANLPIEETESTLALRAFDLGSNALPHTSSLAVDVSRAVRDALVQEKVVRLIEPASNATAALSLEGDIRVQDDGRARVRLRLVDRGGKTMWADRIDGVARESFEIEDAVTEKLLGALRARRADSSGPSNAALRARYEQAREVASRMNPESQREAVDQLERLHAEAPEDPFVASLLAATLCKLQGLLGAFDEAPFARAEELALRALGRAETPALAYLAIALIRSAQADLRAALRAELEALRRSPRMAEAHQLVGTSLCQIGRVHEGMARLRLAMRLDPGLTAPYIELGYTLALLGEYEQCEEMARRVESIEGRPAFALRARLPFLRGDRALAGALASQLAAAPSSGGSWEAARPILEAYARGAIAPEAEAIFTRVTSARVAPRTRALLQMIATDYYCAIGDTPRALAMLSAAAANPGFVYLLWLDHAASLRALRDEPGFAQARAVVAARVAEAFAT